MNILFIGGPMDGKRLAIGDGMQAFYAYETTDVPAMPSATSPKKIEYRAGTLRDKDGRDYVVMTCCGENIIERLISGYDPNGLITSAATGLGRNDDA